jgi:FSR family fosmidomycin resistance protein-like MFS transporter
MAVVLATQLKSSVADHQAAAALVRPARTEKLDDKWGPFSLLTVTIIGRSVIFFGLNTFLPLYWIAVLHQSKESGGRALTLLLVSGATGTLLGGRLSDQLGRRRVINTTMALVPFLLGLLIAAPTPRLAYFALVPLGVILFAPFSSMVVLGQDYLPNRVAMASGVTMGLAGSIGGLAAPILGSIADHRGMRSSFLVLVVLAVVTFLLSTTLHERKLAADPLSAGVS